MTFFVPVGTIVRSDLYKKEERGVSLNAPVYHMEEKVRELCDRFINNFRLIAPKYPKVKDDPLYIVAAMTAVAGIKVSEEKLKLYYDRIMGDGFGLMLSEEFRLFTLGKMFALQDAGSLLTDCNLNFHYIDRVTECTGKQIYLASITMAERFGTCTMEEADEAFYVHRQLSAQNPFVLHTHDVFTGAVLGAAREDSDKLIRDIQSIFDIIKTMYPLGQEVAKYVASVMCLAGGTVAERCKSVKPFLEEAQKAKKEYDVFGNGIALGVVPYIKMPMDEFVRLYSLADEILTPCTFFGKRGRAIKKRRSYALILAAAAAIPAKDENGNTDYAVHDGFNALWIALMALSTILTGRFRMN